MEHLGQATGHLMELVLEDSPLAVLLDGEGLISRQGIKKATTDDVGRRLHEGETIRTTCERGPSGVPLGIDPEDPVGVRVVPVELPVVVPLHHQQHKGGEGDRQSQDIQDHRRPETPEYPHQVSQDKFHINCCFIIHFCQKGYKYRAK